MVSLNQYSKSLTEMKRIEKEYGTSTLTIHFDRLDDKTKEEIINSLALVINERKKRVIETLEGTTVG